MILKTYHIEFLTPCFGAGAEQTKAELRSSEIRGALRWWFRALGGNAIEERRIFGGVHEGNPTSSSLIIRVLSQPVGGQQNWNQSIPPQGMAPKTYLLGFFCGRTGRLTPKGALPPGSKATIQVLFKCPPTPLLERTLKVFFSIGALGFRSTRAAGALASQEHALTLETWRKLEAELRQAGFKVELLSDDFSDWSGLIHHAGGILKNKLRSRIGLGISAGPNGSRANALGSATPRQASVLHFRPVRINHKLKLVLIEAPHERILGKEAQRAHENRGSILALARKKNLLPG